MKHLAQHFAIAAAISAMCFAGSAFAANKNVSGASKSKATSSAAKSAKTSGAAKSRATSSAAKSRAHSKR